MKSTRAKKTVRVFNGILCVVLTFDPLGILSVAIQMKGLPSSTVCSLRKHPVFSALVSLAGK